MSMSSNDEALLNEIVLCLFIFNLYSIYDQCVQLFLVFVCIWIESDC